ALADAEIEPPAGQQVERRGLLGEQQRAVCRQYHHRGTEAQPTGARTKPGQQVDRRRDLAIAGEMVLDDKGAVKAEPLGLDIVFDEIAEAFAAVELGRLRRTGAPRRRAAEQTEPHRAMLLGRKTVAARVGAAGQCSKCRFFIAAIAAWHGWRGAQTC